MYGKELEGERCDFCDSGNLQLKHCREIIKREQDLIIIDKVPAFICNYCGMRYHLAEVTKKMTSIAKNRSKRNRQISVPIAEFDFVL